MIAGTLGEGYTFQGNLGNKRLYYNHDLKKYKTIDRDGKIEDFDMMGDKLW